jgi:alpha/beta superfamily hydrolase
VRLPLVDLKGPEGRIEALLEEVPGARFSALVCHPHPRYGGTMHNHATYRLARAVRTAGGTTLRFHYRGVGRSAGAYTGGPGEVEDARAALAVLRGLAPGRPLLGCGFSFGAWVMAECADELGIIGLLLAGLALRSPELDALRRPQRVREARQPLAVVQAEGDAFGAPAEVRALLAGSVGPRRVSSVPGTTHLFGEDLAGLERAAAEALAWVLAEAALGAPAARTAGGPA